MSAHRLGDNPSSAYEAGFDPEKLKVGAADAFLEISVGDHRFEVALPASGGTVKPEHVATARDVLNQIAELDAVAARDVDGAAEDGDLFVLEIIAEDEIDLRYSAASWNSDWSETFKKEDGVWTHQGMSGRG